MDLHQIKRLEALGDDPAIGPYLPELTALVDGRINTILHNIKGAVLVRALEGLPDVCPSLRDADRDRIRIGTVDDLNERQATDLEAVLRGLKPWRKGPFDIFGIRLDSEWNSALKWARLADHLGSQMGKRVLDIGASNGYYMFRMVSRQPALVMGIEPYLNFYFQFQVLDRYLSFPQVYCVPLKLEEMPAMRRCFDTVLCMGIIYHRRSPLDTLLAIHTMMAPGGQLVLETLIMEGGGETALFPESRYACMNNVFFIPTVTCLSNWLRRCGFGQIRCVDISKTTVIEQRQTDWIDSKSLAEFLDPDDPGRTVEGYPAPVRAMVLATAIPR